MFSSQAEAQQRSERLLDSDQKKKTVISSSTTYDNMKEGLEYTHAVRDVL